MQTKEAKSMTAHDFGGHDAMSALGREYGVTWKGRNYTQENGELSSAITRALLDLRDLEPTMQQGELLRRAFQLVRQRAAWPQLHAAAFLAAVRESEERERVAGVRRALVERERREIGEKLRAFRQQHDFRLYSLKKARELGWPVDDIHPAAETVVDLICQPWEKDDKRLTKVFGFTMFFPGQWGDDPPDEEMFDGDHQAGSLFICQKVGDARDPHALFEQHENLRRALEAEISGPPPSVPPAL
jgi:hypothetical protein